MLVNARDRGEWLDGLFPHYAAAEQVAIDSLAAGQYPGIEAIAIVALTAPYGVLGTVSYTDAVALDDARPCDGLIGRVGHGRPCEWRMDVGGIGIIKEQCRDCQRTRIWYPKRDDAKDVAMMADN